MILSLRLYIWLHRYLTKWTTDGIFSISLFCAQARVTTGDHDDHDNGASRTQYRERSGLQRRHLRSGWRRPDQNHHGCPSPLHRYGLLAHHMAGSWPVLRDRLVGSGHTSAVPVMEDRAVQPQQRRRVASAPAI